MNNKGFTLTEVIVAVAVAGIISLIAFPTISKLREENTKKEFKEYEKVLVNAAKLYMDSHQQDIDISDIYISFVDLKSLGIRSFSKRGINCDSSCVKVTDANYAYRKYIPVLICTKNNKTVYENNSSESGKCSE